VVAEVNGRPFLHFLFDQLVAAGIGHVVLCTGYLAGNVHELIGENYKSIKFAYSVETEPLGTGGALRLALPYLTSDPVLVMNGDSYCDVDLEQFAGEHIKSQAVGSLALATVNDIGRYGAVDITSNGLVTSFEEKGVRQGKGLINAGVYLLAKDIVAAIPTGRPISLERDVFPGLIGNGLCGFAYPGRFIDIGVPDDYRAAAEFFNNNQ
jgi:NDP-sugar pyrophosphorylase family protein